MKLEISDERLIQKAKKVYGRNWQKQLTAAVLKHTRHALGLTATVRPKEASVILGVSTKTIYRYIASGRFPNTCQHNAKKITIPMSDIEALRDNKIILAS